MADEERKKSFWETLPGIITALAALLTGVAAVIAALHGGDKDSQPAAQVSVIQSVPVNMPSAVDDMAQRAAEEVARAKAEAETAKAREAEWKRKLAEAEQRAAARQAAAEESVSAKARAKEAEHRTKRGWLGLMIQDVNEDLAQSFGLTTTEGILVSEVTLDSPAEKAGLKQGDIIISSNGKQLGDVNDLRNQVAMTAPGRTVTLDIIRNSRPQQIYVLIGEQPDDFRVQDYALLEELGMKLQDLTPEQASLLGYHSRQGILIIQVKSGSPAASVGIKENQLIEEVNRVRVHNIDELKTLLGKKTSPDQVLLRVRVGEEYSKYMLLKK